MGEIPEITRLLRNLKDAGCDEAMIQKYLQLEKEGKRQDTAGQPEKSMEEKAHE